MRELEIQLNEEKMALNTDKKVVADLKEKLDREFVTKRNLEVNLPIVSSYMHLQ